MVGRLSDLLPGLGRPGNGAVPFAMRSNGYRLIWLILGIPITAALDHRQRVALAHATACSDPQVERTVTPAADMEHATIRSTGRGPRRRSRPLLFRLDGAWNEFNAASPRN